MKLVMITPRVGYDNPLLGFIPGWITHLAKYVDHLWVITPRTEPLSLPVNISVVQVGRDYSKGETIIHAVNNFHKILWDLTHHEHVDGIFTHMYPIYALLAIPYARLSDIPIITWYSHGHASFQIRLASKFVNKIVTASPESFTLPIKNKVVIGHGVDTDVFKPLLMQNLRVDNTFRIITVGRLSPVKDCTTLIKAASILIENNLRNFKITFLGSAPSHHQRYAEELRDLVKMLNLQEKITFTGPVPNNMIINYLLENDIFINMQAEGGVGKAVLEAMATGIPCIFCTPAYNSHLNDLRLELTYQAGNPDDLADKLQKMFMRSSEERQIIGKKLRQIVLENYNLDILTKRIVKLFTELSTNS